MDTTHAQATSVRAELDRILASELFARSERLSSLLAFIVERTLAGEGDSLKEQVIATELYRKEVDFNPAADPIVRVDARRLRDKLREYYATASPGGVVVTVPKGRYTPIFELSAVEDREDAASALAPPASRAWWVPVAALVLVVGFTWGVTRVRSSDRPDGTRLLTATSLPGAEEDPSLSPDGNFVAFSWGGGEASASHDIWVKAVDGDVKTNLTNTPGVLEKYPKWSPDGQFIAFTRYIKGRPTVFKVSPFGGPEVQIAEGSVGGAWTPDGRSLIVIARTANGRLGLVQHVLETGVRRQLTEVPDTFVESHPRVSPDGKTVAFLRYDGGRSAVFLLPLSGGEPRMLGGWDSGLIGGLEWMPNGRELLIARPDTSGRRLVRQSVEDGSPGVPVPDVPRGSVGPSLSGLRQGRTYRLAFVNGVQDVGLQMVDLDAPQQEGTIVAHAAFCDATRMDSPGRFSPDGTQVAFVSDRSGSQQVWVANRDGSSLRSVTHLRDATVNLGSWSPDGRSLAFDATMAGKSSIFTIAVAGGTEARLTTSSAAEIDPEWSRDGQSIYYSSNTSGNESGQAAIWKVPARGGTPTQLTAEPGFEPRESPDGASIYFIDRPRYFGLGPVATLKRISSTGGPAMKVDVPVMPGAWDLTDKGILFVFVPGLDGPVDFARSPDVLQFYDFAERRLQTIGTFGFRVGPFGANHFLTVSRDGRWALASHIDRWDRDVLVVDKFR